MQNTSHNYDLYITYTYSTSTAMHQEMTYLQCSAIASSYIAPILQIVSLFAFLLPFLLCILPHLIHYL